VHTGETPLGVSPVVAVHLGLEALAAHGQLDLARASVERWAHDPRQPAIGEAAFVTVAVAMSATAPAEAGAWLKAMPPSEARDIALVEFPAHWAQIQPQAALAWAETQLTAELQTRALQRTFFDWAERTSVRPSKTTRPPRCNGAACSPIQPRAARRRKKSRCAGDSRIDRPRRTTSGAARPSRPTANRFCCRRCRIRRIRSSIRETGVSGRPAATDSRPSSTAANAMSVVLQVRGAGFI
jgi:hypothetical protein